MFFFAELPAERVIYAVEQSIGKDNNVKDWFCFANTCVITVKRPIFKRREFVVRYSYSWKLCEEKFYEDVSGYVRYSIGCIRYHSVSW